MDTLFKPRKLVRDVTNIYIVKETIHEQHTLTVRRFVESSLCKSLSLAKIQHEH